MIIRKAGARVSKMPAPIIDTQLGGCEPKQFWERRKRLLSPAAARVTIIATIVAAVAWATSLAGGNKKEIVALTADEMRWVTPPYYHDGRQRAHLFGDSSQGGTWIDRVKI